MNITEAETRVFELVKFLKIPEKRKVNNEVNTKWLLENLSLYYKNNKQSQEAVRLLKKIETPVSKN